MNPPFGGRNGHVPWLRRFLDHGNGIAIVRAYTSSDWFHRYAVHAETMLFPNEALRESGLGFVVDVTRARRAENLSRHVQLCTPLATRTRTSACGSAKHSRGGGDGGRLSSRHELGECTIANMSPGKRRGLTGGATIRRRKRLHR
jgi:hypothetical protein